MPKRTRDPKKLALHRLSALLVRVMEDQKRDEERAAEKEWKLSQRKTRQLMKSLGLNRRKVK